MLLITVFWLFGFDVFVIVLPFSLFVLFVIDAGLYNVWCLFVWMYVCLFCG